MISVSALAFVITEKRDKLPTLLQENIEALTASEAGKEPTQCYDTISSKGEGNMTHITFCGDCLPKLCKTWSDINGCYQ